MAALALVGAILGVMPDLSRFHGIVISMFLERGERHHTPHFHAYDSDRDAVYAFDPVTLLSGSLARLQARLVEAWAELRQAESRENPRIPLIGEREIHHPARRRRGRRHGDHAGEPGGGKPVATKLARVRSRGLQQRVRGDQQGERHGPNLAQGLRASHTGLGAIAMSGSFRIRQLLLTGKRQRPLAWRAVVAVPPSCYDRRFPDNPDSFRISRAIAETNVAAPRPMSRRRDRSVMGPDGFEPSHSRL